MNIELSPARLRELADRVDQGHAGYDVTHALRAMADREERIASLLSTIAFKGDSSSAMAIVTAAIGWATGYDGSQNDFNDAEHMAVACSAALLSIQPALAGLAGVCLGCLPWSAPAPHNEWGPASAALKESERQRGRAEQMASAVHRFVKGQHPDIVAAFAEARAILAERRERNNDESPATCAAELLTERHMAVLEHATAWPKNYRNRFTAGPGHHEWVEILDLVELGLLKATNRETDGDTVTFHVTGGGHNALKKRTKVPK